MTPLSLWQAMWVLGIPMVRSKHSISVFQQPPWEIWRSLPEHMAPLWILFLPRGQISSWNFDQWEGKNFLINWIEKVKEKISLISWDLIRSRVLYNIYVPILLFLTQISWFSIKDFNYLLVNKCVLWNKMKEQFKNKWKAKFLLLRVLLALVGYLYDFWSLNYRSFCML